MTLSRKIRKVVLSLLAASVLLMLAMAAYVDSAKSDAMGTAYANAQRSAEDRRNDQLRWVAQGALAPLARQIGSRRLDIVSQVQDLGARDEALAAAAGPPAKRQAALASLLAGKSAFVSSARVASSSGVVTAAWGEGEAANVDSGTLKDDPVFERIKSEPSLLGQAVEAGYSEEKTANNKKPPKPAKGKPAAEAPKQGLMTVFVGLKNAAGRFAGVLEVNLKVESLLGIDPAATIAPIKKASPHSVLLLMQGTGQEYFNTSGKAFREDFSRVSSSFKMVLAHLAVEEDGGEEITYDGQKGMFTWQRIGYWDQEVAGPEQLHVVAAFFPFSDFQNAGADQKEHGSAFSDPIFWVLFLIVGSALLGGGHYVLKMSFAPLEETVAAARDIDEFGGGQLSEFPQQRLKDLNSITTALNLLLQRASTTEGRVKDLDESLRRQEDQSSQEATELNTEIKRIKQKLSAAEMERDSAQGDLKHSEAQQADLNTKILNLQAAVDTAQKSLDLKNSQNKNLSTQTQELMGALEEQRKIAEDASINTVNRGNEEVRLDAIKTLSSELKATLGVIKNYISTMLGSVGKISDAQQEFLGVVINKSARLERLINDLVDLSQIGTGLTAPKFEKVDIAALIGEVILNVQVQADHKKIHLDYASGEYLEARIDKDRFNQVMRILLTQAIKVTARNETISVLASAREGQVEIRVSDPGMSLPPERAEKVFSLFHGVDSQAGPEFIGTGLRFPIVKSVLESHGGKVSIESQVGRGKSFVLRLPVDGNVGAGKKPAAVSAPSFKPSAPSVSAPALPTAVPAPAAAPPVKEITPPAVNLSKPAPAASPLAALPEVEKPKALPDTLATPWKGEKVSDQLKSIDTTVLKPAAPQGLPAFGAAKTAGLPPVSSAEVAGFDKIFGGPPPTGKPAPPPAGIPTGPPPAGKPSPPLSTEDTANFDKIFGGPPPTGKPAPPPQGIPTGPPPSGKPAPPLTTEDTASFDKIFGGPAPAGVPAPPPPPAQKMDVAPPPTVAPPVNIPAPPPAKPASLNTEDAASFDKIFGAPPTGTPAPPPPKKEPPSAAPPSGGLNTLDDLSNMIEGL